MNVKYLKICRTVENKKNTENYLNIYGAFSLISIKSTNQFNARVGILKYVTFVYG